MPVDGERRREVGTTEAAELLGKSRDTVSDWCRKGKFPNAHQFGTGRPWSIPIEDIEAFERKRRGNVK